MATSAKQSSLKAYQQVSQLSDPPTFPDSIAWEHCRISGEGIADNTNESPAQELTPNRGQSDSVIGGFEVGGTLDSELSYNDLWQEFYASVLGDAWAADAVVPGSTRELWTFQKIIPDSAGSDEYIRYYNSTVSAVAFSIDTEGAVTQTFTTLGGARDPSNVETPVSPQYPPVSPSREAAPVISQSGVTITWGGGLAGSMGGKCHGTMALTIDSQNRPQRCIGNLGSKDVLLGELQVTGEFSLYFENVNIYADKDGRTEGTLTIAFQDSATAANTLTIHMDRVKLIDVSTPLESVEADVMYQGSFRALEPTTLSASSQQVRFSRTPGV